MVDHVTEIVLYAGADLGHASAVQLRGRIEQRRDRMPEHHHPLLELVEAADARQGGALGEYVVLDGLDLDLERVQDREVAVDHRVHQGIEHEARAHAQQLGLALAALAHA